MERTIEKTRRFNALECGSCIEKISLYDQNNELITTRTIQIDKNGKEYYFMPNFYHDSMLFSNRLKDAINTIKAGFGDVISCHIYRSMSNIYVERFVDREYGEELRHKTLEGWKDDVKFAYGINFGLKNSFSEYIVDINDDINIMSKELKPLYFETEQDAQDYIDKMIKIATHYSNKYNELKNSSTNIPKDKEYESLYGTFVENIRKIHHFTTKSFLWNLFAYINENPDNYYCNTVQLVRKDGE